MLTPAGNYSMVLMQGTFANSTVTGAVATGNGVVMYPINTDSGAGVTHTVQIVGISSDTVTFEANIDGSTWVAIRYTNLNTETAATTATVDGLYRATVAGLVNVRARLTRVSGTVVIWGVLAA